MKFLQSISVEVKAIVPVQVSITVFAGDVDIIYAFDGYYVMDTIEFVPLLGLGVDTEGH